MKRVLVLCPNAWDYQAFSHPRLRAACAPVFAGEELLEPPTPWAALTFDIFRYAAKLERRARDAAVEGVIGTGDYPGCMLGALVTESLGLPGPDPRAVTLLSHKFYSRELQARAAPEATPAFCALDPFARAHAVELPRFVKPVKGTMSIRARHAPTPAALQEALRFTFRERLRGRVLLKPFQQLLRRYSDGRVPAHFFVAESPLGGEQVTVDGYVQGGEVTIMGVVDSVMYPGTQSFERFEYPSRLPAAVQARMAALVTRVMRESGLDHSCFNVELFYAKETDQLSIIEINPRMSYQFGDLYERVDGTHTYELQVALALGTPVRWVQGLGPHRAAASFVLRRFSDARVLEVPSEAELARLERQFPGASIKLLAHAGERLSDHDQDVGSFRYCIVNMSAPSAAELHAQYAALRRALPFRFDPEERPVAPRDAAAEALDEASGR